MKKIKIEYFTDPLCSYCYAFEPVLEKLIAEHGQEFDISYHMGGLLKNWDGFLDAANSISSPADVAQHWEHVGKMTGVAISGAVWINDPVMSSYPACESYYVAKKLNSSFAPKYLSALRTAVCRDGKNIGKAEILLEIAEEIGFKRSDFSAELNSKECKEAFKKDMEYAHASHVNGFPTMIFRSGDKVFSVFGLRKYEVYLEALEKCNN